jgi:hypothetical protein
MALKDIKIEQKIQKDTKRKLNDIKGCQCWPVVGEKNTIQKSSHYSYNQQLAVRLYETIISL